MAFANFEALKTALKANLFSTLFYNIGSGNSFRPNDMWLISHPTVGTTPAAATALDSASTGAAKLPNASSARLTLIGAELAPRFVEGSFLIVDRLAHSGGLVGNSSSTQTTNLPTAALTRYTDGVGVMMALSITTAIGSTATTATVSYTNSANVGSRTSQAISVGGAASELYRQRLFILPLQQDDVGVRSVQSLTLAASTGTAGDIAVVLFKPLALISLPSLERNFSADNLSGLLAPILPEVHPSACLSSFVILRDTNFQGAYMLNFGLA